MMKRTMMAVAVMVCGVAGAAAQTRIVEQSPAELALDFIGADAKLCGFEGSRDRFVDFMGRNGIPVDVKRRPPSYQTSTPIEERCLQLWAYFGPRGSIEPNLLTEKPK